MAINYSYPGQGGFNLQTDPAAMGGVGAPSATDLNGFIQQMALRKMQQQQEDRDRAQMLQDKMLHEHEQDRANASRSVNPADDLRMKNLAEGDEIAKSQALRQPAPQKLATGYSALGLTNGPGFTGPDVGALNAYQRQAYLPGNATGGHIPGLDPDVDKYEAEANARQRRQSQYYGE